jgi:hypothetical protein
VSFNKLFETETYERSKIENEINLIYEGFPFKSFYRQPTSIKNIWLKTVKAYKKKF